GRPLPGPVYRALGELSFVELTPHGLVLHAIARAHLAADLRRRRPEWFQQLRRRAVRVLRDELEKAPDRRRVARLLLAICRDILPYGDDAPPAAVPDLTTVDRYRPEDQARLHELLALHPWPHHSAGFVRAPHPLLDDLIAHFPESLQVVRSASGQPLAFFSALLMQRDSVALLLRHVDNAVLQRIEPRWDRDFERHTAETADTYCTPVGAVDPEHPEYSRTDLLNFVIRGFLSLLGERMRGITTATDANAAAALARIGFQRLGPPGSTAQPDEIYELDLRHKGFGEWVERLCDLSAPQARPAGLTAAVREALAALGNADALETGALARTLGSSGPAVRRRLLSLLHAQPPPAPLTGPAQHLLRKAFVERSLAPQATAEQLHVSRATYYRQLRAAVTALAAALLDEALF
ncbi:MAG TPA: hypothetical protein VFK80_10575, partial [Limnochordia bacterium]|nr:hypothetical protein [Limnochordia bacterium]